MDLEARLAKLEKTLARHENSHYASAVVSSFRDAIKAELSSVYDKGWDEGVDAAEGEYQKGRRMYA
jgi:hypothetical protein